MPPFMFTRLTPNEVARLNRLLFPADPGQIVNNDINRQLNEILKFDNQSIPKPPKLFLSRCSDEI